MLQRIRKLTTMHKVLHPRDDVDRLYVSGKEGGRGLASIEDIVDVSIQRLEDNMEKQGGRLITTTRNNTNDMRTNRTTITKKQKWEEKRFKWLISNISHKKIWTCLRKGNLFRETESLLTAAQNAIKTNHIKTRIDKTQHNSKCRLCGDGEETNNHMISECSRLAKKEYKTRHNMVGKVIYWELGKKLKFDHTNKWYMHDPISVLENDKQKLLWDFDIQTDHLISARRPDLIIINEKRERAKLWTLLSRLTTE